MVSLRTYRSSSIQCDNRWPRTSLARCACSPILVSPVSNHTECSDSPMICRRRCRPPDLTAPTTHQALDGGDLEAIVETAAMLGIRTVVHPFTPADRWQSRADIQQLADTLHEAATVGSDFGVTVGYHNHAWELSSHIDGRPALELFADLLDPAVLLEIDTYWAATAG